MFCLLNLSNVIASNILEDLGATFLASFDRAIVADKPEALKFENHGGRIIPNGISGGALQLLKGEYLAFDAKTIFKHDEGTIAFWVRPHCLHRDSSRTFVSFGWDDKEKAYFVITDGWWERDGGRDYTYFIFNNQQKAKAQKKTMYQQGTWQHIVCTWKTGGDGFVRLYVNGVLVGESYRKPILAIPAKGKVYLGSDLGTSLCKERWGDCDFDELAVFKRALQDREVLQVFNIQNRAKNKPLRNAKGQTVQTRAIFDEGRGWMTKAGAEETIKRIKKAGFNVYIPCVWHGQGTRFPSPVAPPEPSLKWTEGDSLKYLIEIAHKNAIEVHAWFTVALRQREFLKEFYDSGTAEGAFNTYNPAFREFIVRLMLDVAKRYNVDGINLDYIRVMGICTSAYCQNQYQKTYKRQLLDDLKTSDSNNCLNEHVQAWIDDTVQTVVRALRKGSTVLKRGIVISVDGHPIPKMEGQSPQGRQEVRWAKNDLVDVIFNMDYKQAPDFIRHEVIAQELGDKDKRVILLIANYLKSGKTQIIPRDPIALRELIRRCLDQYPHGIGIYVYSQLTDEQVDILGSFFNHKSVPHHKKMSLGR